MELDLGLSLPSPPSLDELADIVAGRADEHHEWPPPGMHQPAVFNVWSALVLYGSPDANRGWWWSWADEVSPLLGVADVVLDALVAAGVAVVGPVRTAVQVLGRVPLVYRKVGTAMEWLKVGIHAQLGTTEQMIHTFSLTGSGATPAPLPTDSAGLIAVATIVRDKWTAGLTTVPQPALGLQSVLGSWVKYDYVTATVVRQTTESPKVYVPKQELLSTVVPTERVNWVTPLAGGGGSTKALPYEVACAVSLHTRYAGPRNRGRVYLGGFGVEAIADKEGMFSEETVQAAGASIGRFFQLMRADTPWQVSITSRRALAQHEVVKASVGHVPDSQRSRRWKQKENKSMVWTSPTI